ncbi:hypothetical protein TNCV_1179051 [Trichonephila clavipes]|nr:hypothetical protein TNCV_1179051 [Trichonephila clavipes]
MDPDTGGYAHSDIVWIRYKRFLSVRLFGSCQSTHLDGRYFKDSGEKTASRLEIGGVGYIQWYSGRNLQSQGKRVYRNFNELILRFTNWFQLALYPDAPLLGVLIGSDNLLYFRIMDLTYLLGRKNGTIFARRYSNNIVYGKDVLPLIQKYPRYTANAHLVTRDTANRILCRGNLELAERFSNVLDYGCAYVQGKCTFELSYKSSPRLLVVNTPHESTVKVSQWMRDFMLDVELQRKRATELFREYICSVTPEMLPIYDKTMEVTREINREIMEATHKKWTILWWPLEKLIGKIWGHSRNGRYYGGHSRN